MKISLRCLASVLLGLLRHQLKPWRWMWTIQRWIMMLGHSSLSILKTWGLPSMVQLIGDSPFCFNGWKKANNWGIEFSLTPYCPAMMVFVTASMSVTMLTGRCKNVPSKIRCLGAFRAWRKTGGQLRRFLWMIRLSVDGECPLCSDNWRTEYPSVIHFVNQMLWLHFVTWLLCHE